jgi:hypothetical protein
MMPPLGENFMKSFRQEISRRQVLQSALAGVAAWNFGCARVEQNSTPTPAATVKGALRLEADGSRPLISFLSWDTEGGKRAQTNLLRAKSSVGLRVHAGGKVLAGPQLATSTEAAGAEGSRFTLSVSPESRILAEVHTEGERFTFSLSAQGDARNRIQSVEVIFPFDPRVTPTTVLASAWNDDGSLRLPGVVSAPDYGQMLLSDSKHGGLRARLEGSRDHQIVDLIVELPALGTGETYQLEFSPVRLDAPSGLRDTAMWQVVRRGWFNVWQPSSRWGEQNRPFSAPAGLLSNNVISDPVSFALTFYADLALWTPVLPGNISVAAHVRSTLDWWLEHRMLPTGEVVGYWDIANFLDANTGPLISAWDYVEATGDKQWLGQRIDRLEFLAEFLAKRDTDHDGMVEATQSGNYGTLHQPARSSCWWDALNTGHKDGYSNALIYRAWRCLADLERQLGRPAPQQRYTQLADRLKAVYRNILFNPQTGWLGWWRSADGELHDYATPVVNGLAIEYGLVSPAEGHQILARLRQKMQTVGFNRYDLGFPGVLIPVRKGDYIIPDGLGMPNREDGTDTFGQYMNGGISAGQGSHFVNAHYVAGEQEEGDKMLHAALERQASVGFQNGVRNQGGQGIDWTTWNGEPCGYEGYLADVFLLFLGVLLREPAFRARFYRPLGG